MGTTNNKSTLAFNKVLFTASYLRGGIRILCLIVVDVRKLFSIAIFTQSFLSGLNIFLNNQSRVVKSTVPQLHCCCQCSL
jgi:hypothetical protein